MLFARKIMIYYDSLTQRQPLALIMMELIAFLIGAGSAAGQHAYSTVNTPPILYVSERNWRISEAEQVGQIIARIRAEDAENDDLVFGLEPHFHSNYASPNEDGDSRAPGDGLPFRIDPAGGDVYLKESLVGRAGENFFLYITVSDGQLTAKNEVFVNILGANDKNRGSRKPLSITKVVHNISQFLPAFHQLPGVQSVRNQQLYSHSSSNVPQGFTMQPSFFAPHRTKFGSGDSNLAMNASPNRRLPVWPTNFMADNGDDESDSEGNVGEESAESVPMKTSPQTPTTNRTKLTPISTKSHGQNNASHFDKRRNSTGNAVRGSERPLDPRETPLIHSTSAYSIKAPSILVIIALCGVFAAALVVFGCFFRNRLCAMSTTLTKKSKEEMAKKSNQSNVSGNTQEDSQNSVVMQHWTGPVAFGNRYVPWERNQQMLQSSSVPMQLSTSVATISAGGEECGSAAIGGGRHQREAGGESRQSKYDQWEFPRHRLKFFNILGEGAFGQVWRCEATDIDGFEGVTTVAVKTLKENAAEVEKNDLVSELQVMKSLEPHLNVVRLLGCCTDKDPFFVIIEYVNRGKLQTYLRNSRAERHYGNTHGKSNVLTSGDLTSFMYQVGKGMDYLTSRGIIHRDLAARNVLITHDNTCKVADFGFARDVVTSKIYERKSEGKLPIRWMAIESLYDNIFSVKSDIWSFGILMWEIVTLGSTPYPGISAAGVMRKVRDGHRLEKPEHCRRELYNIMYYCWSENPNERPTFAEVVKMLDKLLHTEMDYIELERFPDHNYYNILHLSNEKL